MTFGMHVVFVVVGKGKSCQQELNPLTGRLKTTVLSKHILICSVYIYVLACISTVVKV